MKRRRFASLQKPCVCRHTITMFQVRKANCQSSILQSVGVIFPTLGFDLGMRVFERHGPLLLFFFKQTV